MTEIPPPPSPAPTKVYEQTLQKAYSRRTKAVEIQDTLKIDSLTAPPQLKSMNRKSNTAHYVGKLTHSAIPQLILEEEKMIPQSVHRKVSAAEMTGVEYAPNAIEDELNEDVTAE